MMLVSDIAETVPTRLFSRYSAARARGEKTVVTLHKRQDGKLLDPSRKPVVGLSCVHFGQASIRFQEGGAIACFYGHEIIGLPGLTRVQFNKRPTP